MSNIFDIIDCSQINNDSSIFAKYRKEAMELLGDIPTLKTEQYQKINISKIINDNLSGNKISIDKQKTISRSQEGAIIKDIESFATENKEVFERYFQKSTLHGAIEQPVGTKFKDRSVKRSFLVDLNTSTLSCGNVVYIPKNLQINEPIELDFSDCSVELGHRDLFIIEPFSKATIIVNFGGCHKMLNRVCEVYLGENSSLDIIEIQNSNCSDVTFTNTIIENQKNSTSRHYSIVIAESIVRNNIKSVLAGDGADTQLFGANMITKSGIVSSHTVIEHNKPNCTSTEHYKNISKDNGVSDFTGMIFVNDDAQKTNANQRNDNLVLNDTAKTHTKPQLEIYADDVKCTHGATVGQLNEDALFYMMQRGMSREEAQNLLLVGFLNDILMKIDCDKIKEIIRENIEQKVIAV